MKIWLVIIFGLLLVLIFIIYLIPARQKDFSKLYSRGDQAANRLKAFMQKPLKTIIINHVEWKYLITGPGGKTILFIHGMGGAYNLWWQQVEYFQDDYKIITFSLPPEIDNLEDAANGIIEILNKEGINELYVAGTSMGGYIAQYLANIMPEKIEKLVLSNTFPPNTLLEKQNKSRIKIVPYLPEIVIHKFAGLQLRNSILPAAKHPELLAEFLPALPFSKKQFVNRSYIVFDKFTPRPGNYEIKRIQKLIIESDNDPLVDKLLREQLKETYNDAMVYTFHGEGHFPYINAAEKYNSVLKRFFDQKIELLETDRTPQMPQ